MDEFKVVKRHARKWLTSRERFYIPSVNQTILLGNNLYFALPIRRHNVTFQSY